MKKEDRPDVSWLINAKVEHLTPEEVRLEEQKEFQPVELQPLPVVEPTYIPTYEPIDFEVPQIGAGTQAFDNNTTDIMYVTSITSLVMITALVLSVVISYTGQS